MKWESALSHVISRLNPAYDPPPLMSTNIDFCFAVLIPVSRSGFIHDRALQWVRYTALTILNMFSIWTNHAA